MPMFLLKVSERFNNLAREQARLRGINVSAVLRMSFLRFVQSCPILESDKQRADALLVKEEIRFAEEDYKWALKKRFMYINIIKKKIVRRYFQLLFLLYLLYIHQQ